MESVTVGADYRVSHTFTGGTTDGARPYGGLLLSGSSLYGMTYIGGASNAGTVFEVDADTSAYSELHSFTGGTDGANPVGSFVQSGSTLYSTSQGGGSGYGVIFSINMSTNAVVPMHIFNGVDGVAPGGQFVLSGTKLYGASGQGGTVGEKSTVYSIDITSNTFNTLHNFSYGGTDGYWSISSLIQSGAYLYGMTQSGGPNGNGTLFCIDTTTNGFTILHSFAGGTADGSGLGGGELTLVGSTLYGTTYLGGSALNAGQGTGTIFDYDLGSQQYSVLHSFLGGPNDAMYPSDRLVQSGNELYGMSTRGGAHADGTIFQFDMTTDQVSLLHSFNSTDGYSPYGSLTLSGSTLYGMTTYGGSNNDGVIFALSGVPEPTTTGILLWGFVGVMLRRRGKRT